MNNRQNIGIYTQLVRFQSEVFSEDTIFVNPDGVQQRTIHELAYRLGLEFEYSLGTRSATATRPSQTDLPSTAREKDFDTFTSEGPRTVDLIDDRKVLQPKTSILGHSHDTNALESLPRNTSSHHSKMQGTLSDLHRFGKPLLVLAGQRIASSQGYTNSQSRKTKSRTSNYAYPGM